VSGQVLFVQGGGAGTHDEWDAALVDSLRRELGDGYEVRYPRLPDEDEPSFARWSAVIRAELASLDDGAAVVGHSVGGAVLVGTLVDGPAEQRLPDLSTVVLVAAPFVGAGGWPSEEFTIPDDAGERLPRGVRVHVVHGLDDATVPPAHADRYARAIPTAQVHLLPGRDHQLDGDLREVAHLIAGGPARPR